MKHNLKISVSKEMKSDGILCCRKVNIREKLLTFLLGKQQSVTILIPSNRIQSVAISEIKEGGRAYEQD